MDHFVSSVPGVEHSPLHYRSSEHDKTNSSAKYHGNYDVQITLPTKSVTDIHLWVNNVENAVKQISHGEPVVFMHTDASTHGWGGVCDGIYSRSAGRWNQDKLTHILTTENY